MPRPPKQPGSPRPRKYATRLPPDQRRAQLLDAAFAVTGRDGLAELTMEAVALAAGVAKPVLYTVFRTRGDLVAALLRREQQRALDQVLGTMPADLSELGPTSAYAATVSAFVQVVVAEPTRWRLILTAPDTAPSEYHGHLRAGRAVILARAEQLARAGIALEPGLAKLDPMLLAHTMLSFAEMIGRLVVTEPDIYTSNRVVAYVGELAAVLTRTAGG